MATIPFETNTPLIVMSSPRPAFVYEGGVRTEKRLLDALGHPQARFSGVSMIGEEPTEVTVELPEEVSEPAVVGGTVILTGSKPLKAELSGGDYGSVRVKIIGCDRLVPGPSAVKVFEQIKATAQSTPSQK